MQSMRFQSFIYDNEKFNFSSLLSSSVSHMRVACSRFAFMGRFDWISREVPRGCLNSGAGRRFCDESQELEMRRTPAASSVLSCELRQPVQGFT